jgi:hypothetical protein
MVLPASGLYDTGQSTDRPGFDALSEYFAHNPTAWFSFSFLSDLVLRQGLFPCIPGFRRLTSSSLSRVSGDVGGHDQDGHLRNLPGFVTGAAGITDHWVDHFGCFDCIRRAGGDFSHSSTRPKRLLAYHSIENIGIIGIGIGLGVIGIATANPILAMLGFAGGLLHVLNHSLFKSLLFYNAGPFIYLHTPGILSILAD